MFPVLPDITLLMYDIEDHRDVTISCRREVIVPAHVFTLRLAQLQDTCMSEQERVRTATMNTYIKCLGLDPEIFTLLEEVPEAFTQVILGGGPWNIRRLECSTENTPMFYKLGALTANTQGSEWTREELRYIVRWSYTPIYTRESRMQ